MMTLHTKMAASMRVAGARLFSRFAPTSRIIAYTPSLTKSPTSSPCSAMNVAVRTMAVGRRSPIEYDYIPRKERPKPPPPPEDIFQLEKCEKILQTEEFDVLKKQSQADTPLSDLPNPYAVPPVKCILCQHDVELDYKNVRLLSQFVSPHSGQIYGRHITGLCVYMHRRITVLIKRARFFGYMPYVMKQPEYLKDPQLYNAGQRKH